jgi:cysteine desulfuration protein SufE
MYESCLEKQQRVKDLFSQCSTEELKYQKIIELGKQQAPFPAHEKVPANIVKGCQSTMYLSSRLEEGKVIFAADSDALISSGLAAILICVYSGETPESILKCPPTYLDELGIGASLTPSRANGLYSVHLRMKQDALKLFMQQQKNSDK